MILKYFITILFFAISQIFAQSVSWEKINLKFPSYVTSFGFNSKDYIYIGTRDWGIFRSTDLGKSWERLYEGLSLDRVDFIYETPEKNLLAGISFGGHLDLGPTPLGVFRSENDGDEWENVLKTIWVQKIQSDSKNYIYACTNSFNISTKLCCSEDDGETWERIDSKLPEYDIIDMEINRNDNIIVTNHDGVIYSSSNRGESWDSLENSSATGFYSLTYNSKGILFSYNKTIGLCKSFDQGKGWYKTNLELTEHIFRSLTIDKNDRLFVITRDQGLFISSDNGLTWENLNEGLLNKNITAIGFDNQNNIYIGLIQPDKKYEDDYYIVLKGFYK
jgi:photosystem II stability/assembly factor-like uncharacterized protein